MDGTSNDPSKHDLLGQYFCTLAKIVCAPGRKVTVCLVIADEFRRKEGVRNKEDRRKKKKKKDDVMMMMMILMDVDVDCRRR